MQNDKKIWETHSHYISMLDLEEVIRGADNVKIITDYEIIETEKISLLTQLEAMFVLSSNNDMILYPIDNGLVNIFLEDTCYIAEGENFRMIIDYKRR